MLSGRAIGEKLGGWDSIFPDIASNQAPKRRIIPIKRSLILQIFYLLIVVITFPVKLLRFTQNMRLIQSAGT